jgi:hypothetical protein
LFLTPENIEFHRLFVKTIEGDFCNWRVYSLGSGRSFTETRRGNPRLPLDRGLFLGRIA